jgi:TolA-binding protein
MNRLEELGQAVVAAEEKLLAHQRDIESSRAAFLKQAVSITSSTPKGPAPRVLVPSMLGAALAGAMLFLFVLSPLEDEKASDKTSFDAQLPTEEERRFQFPDGSRVVFSSHTLGQITSDDEKEVRVRLKRGSARIAVTPRREADWKVWAGPYHVRVTGTELDVVWHPETQVFRLALLDGEVVVRGPMLPDGQRVKAGRTLVANVASEKVEIFRSGSSERAGVSAPTFDTATVADTEGGDDERTDAEGARGDVDVQMREPPSSAAHKRRPSNERGWLSLAKKGNYKAAFDLIGKSGIDEVIESGNAEHLLLLADTARWNGKLGLSESIYLQLRRRFPNSSFATISALQLGRMEFDQRRRFGKAAYWLETYLSESTGNTLERETIGRLMEAQKRAGDTRKAKATARRYLLRYPNGPHAKSAENLIGK